MKGKTGAMAEVKNLLKSQEKKGKRHLTKMGDCKILNLDKRVISQGFL